MSPTLDHKLILNRKALDGLHQAGLSDRAVELIDITAARKLALWRQGSGTDLYLLALVIAASRQVALCYFGNAELQPTTDRVVQAGQSHNLPELGTAYRVFLDCYPREELQPASKPEATAAAELSRLRLLAEIHDFLNQGTRVEIEILKALRGELDVEIAAQQEVTGPTVDEASIGSDSEHQLWPYEGEFWRDELGYYRQPITNRCGR